jgi:hypothetical protein
MSGMKYSVLMKKMKENECGWSQMINCNNDRTNCNKYKFTSEAFAVGPQIFFS